MQQENESADDFISRLKLQAYICAFRDDNELHERVIEQFIAGTRHTELQKELLGKDISLTLEKAIEIARTFEAWQSHMAQLARVQSDSAAINAISTRPKQKSCPNCSGFHASEPRQICPAFGSKCRNCGKMGHWDKVCRSKATNHQKHDSSRYKKYRTSTSSTRRSTPLTVALNRHSWMKYSKRCNSTKSLCQISAPCERMRKRTPQ